MARIAFTSEIAELVGRLAGSVFQYSYGGWQVHTRVTPANPQTERQQLRRGWFGWFAQNWRNLTPAQQSTFNTAAGSVPEGFRLFLSSNINAYLIDEPTITTYVASAAPQSMNVVINSYQSNLLQVVVNSGLTVVPSGCKLLIFATSERVLNKRFTNPSDYSPIVYYNEGTNMGIVADVTAAWTSLYGVLTGGNRVCVKSVVIKKSNGSRSSEFIDCSPPVTSDTFLLIDSNGDAIIDSNSDFVVYQ